MKKNAIITYLLAFALLLSACVYRIPDNTQGSSAPALQDTEATSAPTKESQNTWPTNESENIQPSSDTSPTFESIEYSMPTGTIATPMCGDTITVGPYKFEYGEYKYKSSSVFGFYLISCDNSVEIAVIPSEVAGFPVIGISHYSASKPPFSEGSALKSIVIPDSVFYIGYEPFINCKYLTDISLSCNIQSVGDCSPTSVGMNPLLKGTAVRFLNVPEGITSLDQHVFVESPLESIVLPSTLEYVEEHVFADCPYFEKCPLKEVFYCGTMEQCPQTLLDEVAETEATLYFYSEEEPTEEGNFWYYVYGAPVIW